MLWIERVVRRNIYRHAVFVTEFWWEVAAGDFHIIFVYEKRKKCFLSYLYGNTPIEIFYSIYCCLNHFRQHKKKKTAIFTYLHTNNRIKFPYYYKRFLKNFCIKKKKEIRSYLYDNIKEIFFFFLLLSVYSY